MTYYIMECEGPNPILVIEQEPDLPGGPWYHGEKLKFTVPTPLEYVLEEDDEEPHFYIMKLYCAAAYPIMHNSLLEALQLAGVTNLELFPVRLTDPNTGKIHEDYYAFNVLGLVSAADLKKSTLMYQSVMPTTLDTNFDSLVIDEQKAKELHLFRLAESCSAIVVSEKVKQAIEEKSIPGMVFYKSGEWSG